MSHVAYLKRYYVVEGLDISPAFLKRAKAKNPGTTFYRGDMCTFTLKKHFDLITCLFSAIGHVKTKARMRKAVSKMAKHLNPGGLLLIEPWFSPVQWNVGHLSANFVDQPKLKLARLSISKGRQNLSVNDEHHLAASPKGMLYFVERLEMGLLTPENYIDAFKHEGSEVTHDSEGLIGRGLYIGLKP